MVDYRIDVVVDPRGAATGTHTVERQLTRVENRANAMRASIGRLFAMFGGAAIVGTTIRTLASFEQAMTTVGAVAGASAREMEQLRAAAERLGATTRFTATEAGEGLLFLARAGFDAQESLGTIDGMLRLAQVGALDLGRAADIATNVLTGFGLAVSETGRFVDVLAKAANSGNTNVQQLGDAFKYVAPVASGMNVSLEETAAAIVKLSDAGMQATMAGTGLRKIITELEGPSNKTRKVLEQVGLSTEDVRVSSVGLANALKKLDDAGVTTTQVMAMFGLRGGPAAIKLIELADATKELTGRLEESQGYAEETAKKMDDNLMGALLRVKSAFQAVILAVGRGGATSSLRGVMEGLANGLRFMADHADKLISFLKTLSIVMGTKWLLGAIKALTVAMATNPFGLIAVGLALVVSLVPDFQNAINDLIGDVERLGAELVKGIDFTAGLLAVSGFVDDAIALFKGLLAGAGAVFDELGNSPEHVGELLKRGFRNALEAIIKFFLGAFQTLGNIIRGMAKDIVSIIAESAAAMGAVSVGKLDAAKAHADNATDYVKRSLSRITSFSDQFAGNMKKMEGIDILPKVEISREAEDMGKRIADEFKRAFEESGTPATDILKSALGTQADLNEAAAKAGAEAQNAFEQGRLAAAAAAKKEKSDPFAKFSEDNMKAVNELLGERVQILDNIKEQMEILAIKMAQDKANTEDYAKAYRELELAALEASTRMEAGFERAFIKMRQGADDLASATEEIVNLFADKAVDAIHTFVNTGKFSFKEFATAILSDIQRIIIRLLVMRAISALGGVTGFSPVTPTPAPMAEGGPVRSGRSYLVGEEGPELFTPNRAGSITPNGDLPKAERPEVKVQVVNVQDPNEVPQAIGSGRADEAILNLLMRNKDRVTQVLQ